MEDNKNPFQEEELKENEVKEESTEIKEEQTEPVEESNLQRFLSML